MKVRSSFLRIFFLLFQLGALVYSSCSESMLEGELNEPDFETLLNYEQRDEISTTDLVQYWGNNDTANQFITHDLRVYSLTYLSQDDSGEEITLSGAVVVPIIEKAKGILSIQHATFFDDNEAPSENRGFSVVTRKAIFASYGYITFLPDYLGYGVDKDRIHPYHHASTLASAAEDFIVAGKELLEELDVTYDDKLFLAGYSEGAYATAALQQSLEKTNTTITASSLGAGSYNIKKTVESFLTLVIEGANCNPCNAFFLQAYDDVYGLGQPMEYYFQQPYADVLEDGLLLGEFSGTVVNQSLPADPSLLFSDQFISDYLNDGVVWSTILEENSIHLWQPRYPVLLTHGQNDNVSPYFNSIEMAELNHSNPNVNFMNISYQNHFEGIFPWGITTMLYFDQF